MLKKARFMCGCQLNVQLSVHINVLHIIENSKSMFYTRFVYLSGKTYNMDYERFKQLKVHIIHYKGKTYYNIPRFKSWFELSGFDLIQVSKYN